MTRAEHLQWSKDRALEYLKAGDILNAWASMVSDLRKHKELENHSAIDLGMMLLLQGENLSTPKMTKFIEGFN